MVQNVAKELADSNNEFGPMMRKLTIQEQLFVCQLFSPYRSITQCAASAGYKSKNREALRMRAHRLLRDPKIGDAVREESKRRTVFLLPKAQNALEMLLEHPEHTDHFKAVKMVRDDGAVSQAVERVLKVDVKVEITSAEKIKAIEAFARNHNIDPKTLLGFDPGETVDAEFTEVEHDPDFDKEFL
jgi:phage terminase small subunit